MPARDSVMDTAGHTDPKATECTEPLLQESKGTRETVQEDERRGDLEKDPVFLQRSSRRSCWPRRRQNRRG
jgi:hypothetical protein